MSPEGAEGEAAFPRSPVARYQKFVDSTMNGLKLAEAYIPRASGNSSPIKPSWWSHRCDKAKMKKAEARRAYHSYTSLINFEFILKEEKACVRILT